MRRNKLLAAMLACLLLTGCGAKRTEPLAEEPAAEGPEIAYVPLDDRPDNVERVVYLAESLGYTLAMPEAVLYQTRLDGQPRNFDSLQRGEPWSLFTWVLEQEAEGCDRYILSLDQLCSGGLVSSRAMTEDTLELPGGGTVLASQLIEELLTALAADKNNVVWLLDSVMRLAPTVGYEGGTLEEYNALRAYGAEGRPVLTGQALTVENIIADYRLGGDGTELDPAAFGLTEVQVEEYLTVRQRKLALADEVISLVRDSGAENFHVLIGIDDSSEEDSIQKNEIAYLRSRLREEDALLSGVDDLAFKAAAKLYLEENAWGDRPVHVGISYYGGTEDQPACDYDYKPLKEIVEEHLDFFGAYQLSGGSGAADVELLVLTQPDTAAWEAAKLTQAERDRFKKNACTNLVEWLGTFRNQHVPVILIDASNGAYGNALQEALTKEAELGYLLSYAGFLDMAIVTGTALSHGLARYAVLKGGANTDAMDRAWARTLADSVIKDFCYKHVVREDLLAHIRNDLGGDPNNFWVPDIDREAILARLESGMAAASAEVIRNLERSNMIASLEPYEEVGWGGIQLANYRFPWDRAFEIGVDIKLGAFTEPHKKALGLYWQ
ncbi:DUF4127 family protein [uncultured Dysosmobacter sp.]|uniref:DUF4127 family protein n=1 Tax=uncultured Dysosmobacter sp. TaxID=2591384 RepID=UPI00261D9D3D|nr:DUF4127 family protein [uncultured Dysosmobacter sp.]